MKLPEELKKKLYYSLDLGLFLAGILISFFCKSDACLVSIRACVGEVFIISSYFLFPFISKENKDKYYLLFVSHFLMIVLSAFVALFSIQVYITNLNSIIWWQEILAALGFLFVFTYLSYILINFARAFYLLSAKLISFLLNTNVKENYSNAKKIIEKVTAFIVTMTALAASVTTLIASIKALLRS